MLHRRVGVHSAVSDQRVGVHSAVSARRVGATDWCATCAIVTELEIHRYSPVVDNTSRGTAAE